MADRAVLREASGDMVGIGGLVVVSQVARSTILRGAGVSVIDVALLTGNIDMRTGQGKSGESIVVEPRSCPPGRSVTEGAFGGESSTDVVWVSCRGIVLGMACKAVCRSALIATARVAGSAG